MEKEHFGILAKSLRVKITREPQVAGKAYKIPGQIGFKRRDGQWDNYWIDVWCWPDQGERLGLAKGDVVFVTGQFKMLENTYQGNTRTEYSVWADEIRRQGDQPQERQSARGNQNPGRGRQQYEPQPGEPGGPDLGPAFPSEASGMDQMPEDGLSDVPF